MGRTELYASNPVQTASTLSHWDPLARPDLLMEPEIATKAPHDQRMELAVFRDIGWRTAWISRSERLGVSIHSRPSCSWANVGSMPPPWSP